MERILPTRYMYVARERGHQIKNTVFAQKEIQVEFANGSSVRYKKIGNALVRIELFKDSPALCVASLRAEERTGLLDKILKHLKINLKNLPSIPEIL